MYGWRARIGVLIPSNNSTLEADFAKMAPLGVKTFTARMKIALKNNKATLDALQEMDVHVEEGADELATINPPVDIIVFGCTSGSLAKGKNFDQEIVERIEKRTGIKATTTSTAVTRALRKFHGKNLSIVTPYVDEVNLKVRAFFETNGFNVVRLRALDKARMKIPTAANPPWVAFQLAKKANCPEVDGIFVSCTNFRAIEMISILEKDTGKFVVTANQASLWDALDKIGVKEPVHGYGRLMHFQYSQSELGRRR